MMRIDSDVSVRLCYILQLRKINAVRCDVSAK